MSLGTLLKINLKQIGTSQTNIFSPGCLFDEASQGNTGSCRAGSVLFLSAWRKR